MKKKTPNLWSRLGGFAAIHFSWSPICFAVFYGLLMNVFYDTTPGPPFLYFLLMQLPMVLYFPLGVFLGAAAPWARVGTLREAAASVLLQAGIAVAWGELALLMMYSQAGMVLLAWLFLPTLVLTTPSWLFVLSFAALLSPEAFLSSPEVAAGLTFFAGLLPPLLYNLGNLLVSRRKVEKATDGQ